MYYPDEMIEEVRSRSDIVDVISSNVSLKKKGNNYWGLCPFHNEHTPSFSVNGNKQMFHCFGCGEGGNVISFVMKYNNITFPEAIRQLAERSGVQLPEVEMSDQEKRARGKRDRMLALNKDAATYFFHVLRTPHGERGMSYLKGRMLTDETMKHFGLGYAGMNGRDLVQYLRSKGYRDEEIKEAGLASFSEKNGLVSQFWNRVMFPIFDANDRVIGFGGRVMGDAQPKYLNSPETMVFDKRRNLYGLNYARKSRTDYFILCEGYMDVISMHQAGFTEAMASLGTAFTEEQAMLLKRYNRKILLAYDSDGAGTKAALRALGILRNVGMSGRVIHLEPYKDPDEFIKNEGEDAFRQRVNQAENGFFFECKVASREVDQGDPEQRTNFHRELAQKLCVFSDMDERENYLQAICQEFMIPVEHMRDLVAKYAAQAAGKIPAQKPKATPQKKNSVQDGGRRAQKMLLTWLTDQPALYATIRKYISPTDFTEDLYRQVAERLFDDLEKGTFQPAAIISLFEEEQEQREVAELFQTQLPHTETAEEEEKAFHDIIYAVKQNSYEAFCASAATSIEALQESMNRKKELEQLAKTRIKM